MMMNVFLNEELTFRYGLHQPRDKFGAVKME
jgi:hypothetical protein